MRIGIFDSGKGGQAVANTIKTALPKAEIIYVDDSKNMPYGSRPATEIIGLTIKAVRPLVDNKCDVIVIACNTATTVAIDDLRLHYPNMRFVGIEPMLKPASQITRSKRIAVCATPGTLRSQKYLDLKKQWAQGIDVIEPDCGAWAELIEKGHADKIDIVKTVNQLSDQQVDVIVLGCTHYHWIKDRITSVNDTITVLEPSDAINDRVISLIG